MSSEIGKEEPFFWGGGMFPGQTEGCFRADDCVDSLLKSDISSFFFFLLVG